VARAEVRVDGGRVAAIGRGLLVLLAVAPGDDQSVTSAMAAKVAGLRIFADGRGLTNLAVTEVGGSVLVVSQFTLYADTRRGRRPSFIGAAGPEIGERLYEAFCDELQSHGLAVERGRFGAQMDVELVNDGPFTIWLDSDEPGKIPRV